MTEQLIKSASGCNNNEIVFATSSGVVVRRIGFRIFVFSTHVFHFLVIFVNARVGVIPACIALAVIPCSPSYQPICRIIASIATLATLTGPYPSIAI